jgi:hypothetical protein
MPEAQPLALLRRDIDRKPEAFKRVLTDAALRKTILGGLPNDEKKAIKAFASQNAENALKTKPKVCLDYFCQSQQCSPIVYFVFLYFLHAFRDESRLQSVCTCSPGLPVFVASCFASKVARCTDVSQVDEVQVIRAVLGCREIQAPRQGSQSTF